MRARPDHRLARVLPALVALGMTLLVSSQLASALHYVIVVHSACAEHGTVHHGEAAEREAFEHRARPLVKAVVLPADEHAAHDHCGFAACARDLGAAPSAAFVRADAPGARASAEQRSPVLALASISILSLAPKQSPPASA